MPLVHFLDDTLCSPPYSLDDMKFISSVLALEKTKLQFPGETVNIRELGARELDFMPFPMVEMSGTAAGKPVVEFYKQWKLYYLVEFEKRRSKQDWAEARWLAWPFDHLRVCLPFGNSAS